MRVAFPFLDREAGWMGGVNYLRNLFLALRADPDGAIQPVLLVPLDMPEKTLAHFAGTGAEVLPCPLVGSTTLKARAGIAAKRLIGRDPVLEPWLARRDIALVSHLTTLGARSRIPSLAWIPDFQHLRLPELFTPKVRAERDTAFRRLARQSSGIIVSSEDARADLARFIPEAAARTHVLNFVADVDEGAVASRAELETRHGFTGPYFFLPNQFWAHKNHAVVIEALGQMLRDGDPVLVLATGNPANPHAPGHFDTLMARAHALGVEDWFRPLGLVPRADLVGLMRGAVALINPSRFEGWSSTVEEAKSLGKRVVLSDIAVHREQAPESGVFFAPDDPAGLATALRAEMAAYDPVHDAARIAAATEAFPARRVAFSRQYHRIAEAVVGAKPNR